MKLPRSVGLVSKGGLLALLLMFCLGSEYLHRAALPWQSLNHAQAEVFATFQAVEVQWLVVICTSIYFVGFVWLYCVQDQLCLSWRDGSLVLSLILYAIGALAYASNYNQASKSTDTLLLISGFALHAGFRFWQAVESTRSRPLDITAVLLGFTLIMFSLAVLWHPVPPYKYQYLGHPRWSGLWNNPNTFGMLIGVGCVLALGQLVFYAGNIEHRTSNAEHRSLGRNVWRWLKVLFFVIAAVVCGMGLIKSYSRGAWVGAVLGLSYLAWSCWRTRSVLECGDLSPLLSEAAGRASQSADKHDIARFLGFLRRNWLPVSAVLVSVLLLAFWNFRHTEQHIVRRAFSFGNLNDFSWRNRVAAYEGSLQMMADRPWLGFGWNQPERVYNQFYLAPQVAAGAAIQLNDYFTLGTTLGIPALVCFVAYVGLSLTQNRECGVRNRELGSGASPQPSPLSGEGGFALGSVHLPRSAICRAGAVVLLVGFWFDGGLFNLATGSVFWILLALGEASEAK